jgi:hypothetical protein
VECAAKHHSGISTGPDFRRYKGFNILVCGELGISLVHIFKAAGTSLNQHFRWMVCPKQPKLYTEQFGHLSPEMQELDGTTAATFLRDPIERFQSGLADLLNRARFKHNKLHQWRNDIVEQATAKNTTCADAAIDWMLSIPKQDRFKLINTHLCPQSWFLLREDQSPIPQLGYLGILR